MNKYWKRSRNAGLPVAVVAALSAAADAQAAASGETNSAPPEGYVAIDKIKNLASSETLPNGDIKLILKDGTEVTIPAESVKVVGDSIYANASALTGAGLEVSGFSLSDFIAEHHNLVGLSSLAGAGLVGSMLTKNEAPVFTSGTSASVNENSTSTGYVASATDKENDTLSYSIGGGIDAAKFTINSTTGALSFLAAPDFEAPGDANADNTYEVIVKVSDSKHDVTQVVSIKVNNVNDVAPVFTSGATATLSENSIATGYVTTATDIEHDTLTFGIDGGADAAKFAIDATTGVLSFVTAPDYETPTDAGGDNAYEVVLRVSDGVHVVTKSVVVTVTNVNDVAPVFTSGSSATVSENSVSTGYVAAATDVEHDSLTFAIDGGADAAKFTIDAATGALSFVAAPDFESPTDAGGNNTYDVTVKVSDGVHNVTQSVSIVVTNVNDVAPVFSSGATVSVSENSVATGYIATASDIEHDTLTYGIAGGVDAAKFAIDAATGALRFLTAPDFEAPTDAGTNNVYDVVINVFDGVHTVNKSVTVTVTNVNDVAPVFSSGSSVSVAENSIATGYVAVATDVEHDTLTYGIAGGADATKFTINASTGALSFVTAPDFEAPADAGRNNVYDVVVKVFDGVHTVNKAVAVTVTNVNDVAPVFTSGSTVYVVENATATGYTAVATDVENDTLTYALGGGADAAKFSIDAATGVLSFLAAPDFEAPSDANADNNYDVVITVFDGVHRIDKAVSVHVTTPPHLNAHLSHDTGLSDSDSLTSDGAITGDITGGTLTHDLKIGLGEAPGTFANIGGYVDANGHFTVTQSQIETALGVSLADGDTVLQLRYVDGSGQVVNEAVSFELDRSAPVIANPGLSTSSDTGTLGDLTTSAGKVAIVGSGEALSTVSATIDGVEHSALVNLEGRFTLNDIPLDLGANTVTLHLTDAAGNSSSTDLVVQREAATGPDPVLFWNAVALQAIVNDGAPPTFASRGLAMQSIAVYDALAALDGSTPFMVGAHADAGADAAAAVAYASASVLKYLFPRQAEFFDAMLENALSGQSGAAFDAGKALGSEVGDLVVAIRDEDGWNAYATQEGGDLPGQWSPTEPSFAPALDPQWADLKPFAMTDSGEFLPDGPPALTSEEYTQAYNELVALGSATSSTRTADQTQIANFWRGNTGTVTPAGMWNQIAAQAATAEGGGIASNARMFALLNVSMADAGVAAWNTKYTYDFWRPIEAVRSGDLDGNDATAVDAEWRPLLLSPNFPEYVSGHSTYSAAAATVLSSLFGDNYAFSFASSTVPGVERHYDSFEAAAEEAGRSRVYGGIHFEFSNQTGQVIGHEVAHNTLDMFNAAKDTSAPTIIFTTQAGQAYSDDLTINGTALDTLSGLKTVTAKIDDGAVLPVTVDALGHFSIPVTTGVGGLADGTHTLTLHSEDGAGNVSDRTFDFTVDTAAPDLAVTSFTDGATISSGARLSGTIDPTGSNLVHFSYVLDGGTATPLSFDGVAKTFDAALALGDLAAGDHKVTITAEDAAGNVTTQDVNFHLDSAIPLTIVSVSPQDGATEVGVTQRPHVVFSRAVDPATVTANSFYATDASGAVVPANIILSDDNKTAYLFFDDAMKGAESFQVHVVGDLIHAAADNVLLDGDDDGTAGGSFTSDYTTVNTDAVPNTSITGFIVGPGNDLKPMTQDDFRSGPDGIPFTDDDIFLERLAGVKVYILGRESEAVLTDDQGRFTLTNVPSGDVKIAVDGRTATNAPAGSFYPEMVMDVKVRPGVVNTIMGTMGDSEDQLIHEHRGEVYLPRLAEGILQDISNTEVTVVTAIPEATQGLSAEQASHLTLTVQPGSILDANGDPVANPQVGISTVPPELVRDMLPPGILEHTFDITIQAPDGAVFTTPMIITLPNVFGAAPGTKLNILSFDHTTGRLVIDGTGTVSADGLTVVSDPDSGITHAGWHGMTPPGTPVEGPDKPDVPDDDPDDDCSILDELKEYAAVLKAPNVQDALVCLKALAKSNIVVQIGTVVVKAVKAAECGYKAYEHGKEIGGDLVSISHEIQSGITAANKSSLLNKIKDLGLELNKARIDIKTCSDELSKGIPIVDTAKSLVTCAKLAMSTIEPILNKASTDQCLPGVVRALLAPVVATYNVTKGILNLVEKGIESFEKSIKDGIFSVAVNSFSLISGQIKYWEKFIESYDTSGGHKGLSLLSDDQPTIEGLVKFLTETSSSLDKTYLDIKTASDGYSDAQSFGSEFGENLNSELIRQLNSAVDEFYVFQHAYYGNLVNSPYIAKVAGTVIRGETDENGDFNLFLQDGQPYEINVVDLKRGLIGTLLGISAPSGQITKLDNYTYQTFDNLVDTDGDGLPDLAEEILGTSGNLADTDGDGLSDKFELDNGLDPLGGFPTATGVLATIDIGATINDIVTFHEGASNYAAVAAGDDGLVLVDISAALNPIRAGVLDLPGSAVDVDVDSALGLAAVAIGSGGLKIVDVSDPAAMTVIASVGGSINQVEVMDGVALAASGSNLLEIDLTTGEVLQTLGLPGGNSVKAMTHEGNFVYTLSTAGSLNVTELVNGVLISRGSLSVSGQDFGSANASKIFVADGVLYIPADRGFQSGYATVDVSDPAHMTILSNVDDGAIYGSDIALNGSGLGIAVGEAGGVFGTHGVDVVRTGDTANTGDLVTRFTMNATPSAVAIGAGFAFVGDVNGGFHVVNYQAFDTGGTPPVVTLQRLPLDIDTVKNGIQVQEGQTVSLGVKVTDDAQVRQVELLVNGVAQPADIAYPWDMHAALPSIAANGGNIVTLQVRATDSGGNTSLSDVVTVELVPDTTPPHLVSANLDDGDKVSQHFHSVRFTFDEALGEVPADAISLKLADGTIVAAEQLFLKDTDHTVQANFADLAPGEYDLLIDQSKIADRAGNAIGDSVESRHFTVSDAFLDGAELQYQYLFPNSSSPYAGALNFTVGDGVEIATTFEDSSGAAYLAYYNSVDVGDDTITVTFTGSVNWNGAGFNGFRISDVNHTVSDFVSATDADARTTLSVDADNIYVNWNGQAFNPGDVIVIHINDGGGNGLLSNSLSAKSSNIGTFTSSPSIVSDNPADPADTISDLMAWKLGVGRTIHDAAVQTDDSSGTTFISETPALARVNASTISFDADTSLHGRAAIFATLVDDADIDMTHVIDMHIHDAPMDPLQSGLH